MFLQKATQPDQTSVSVLCDSVSICSHLARTTPDHLLLLMDIFKGDKSKAQTKPNNISLGCWLLHKSNIVLVWKH